MSFPQALDQLIERYSDDPTSIGVADIKPLIAYISQQSFALDDRDVSYSALIQGSRHHVTSFLTIGVHGNEVLAGAYCALEVLKAQKKGRLHGRVLIQLGNEAAIAGYLDSYKESESYAVRAGWRSTYGDGYSAVDVDLPDGTTIQVENDLNRVPKNVMDLPRGLHPNIDRAQDLILTIRSVKNQPWENIGYIAHPHSSYAVGGLYSLAFPRPVVEQFKDAVYGDPFQNLPPQMRNILRFNMAALSGQDNVTLTKLISQEFTDPPLIVTAELGQHENDGLALSGLHGAEAAEAFMSQLTRYDPLHQKRQRTLLSAAFNVYSAGEDKLTLKDCIGFDALKPGMVLTPSFPYNVPSELEYIKPGQVLFTATDPDAGKSSHDVELCAPHGFYAVFPLTGGLSGVYEPARHDDAGLFFTAQQDEPLRIAQHLPLNKTCI